MGCGCASMCAVTYICLCLYGRFVVQSQVYFAVKCAEQFALKLLYIYCHFFWVLHLFVVCFCMHLDICFELYWSCCSDLERLLWPCALDCMKISTTKISWPDLKGGFLKPKHDQPVNSWDSIMGATGGPCNGHLVLSHVILIEASAVGQLNSSPSLWQTWAESPACNVM